MRRRFLGIAALGALPALFLSGLVPARADLAGYLQKPEPVYKWEKQGETKLAGGVVYDLHLVSQTWQGIVWEHHLMLFQPDKPLFPHFCTLLNTGGHGGKSDYTLGMQAAQSCSGPFAILFDIPNQPLYGGKTEDALIVYTWQKFLETGDELWPLHFPMAKAVLKAMDALQAFTKGAGQPELQDFLITGASKRGWTTWLTGASRDPRVVGIAPMVIDTLNLPAQGPHQLEAFGKPSEQIGDYTNAGMMEALKTPKGRRLIQLEDPYSYRDRLTLPKLIVLATNDRYWAQDALNLYWDALKGPKWVLYNPNVGHSLGTFDAQLRVLGAVGAFARSLAGKTAWPKPKWEYTPTASGVDLVVRSDIAPLSARLWHASGPTLDLRDAKWTSDPLTVTEKGISTHLDTPAEGVTAAYAELNYRVNNKDFSLCTQIHILGKPTPAK